MSDKSDKSNDQSSQSSDDEQNYQNQIKRSRKSSSNKSRSRSHDRSRRFKGRYQSRSNSQDKMEQPSYQSYKGKQRYGHMKKQFRQKGTWSQVNQKTQIFTPYLDGNLVSFRTFMENQVKNKFYSMVQSDKLDHDKALEVYKNYQNNWIKKQDDTFYTEHQEEEWFLEKYDLFRIEKLKTERNLLAQQNAGAFKEKLDNNGFDNIDFEYDGINEEKEEQQQDLSKINEEDGSQQQQVKQKNLYGELQFQEDKILPQYYAQDPNSSALFIPIVPKHISRWEIKEAIKHLTGFAYLSLSEPNKYHEYQRIGWIIFDTEENCKNAMTQLQNFELKNFHFEIKKSESKKSMLKVTKQLDSSRILQDLEITANLIKTLDKEKNIECSINLEDKKLNDFQKLDLQLHYLRKVHSYCFYCGQEFADERILTYKCGLAHLRLKFNPDKNISIPDWHNRIIEIANQRIKDGEEAIQNQKSAQNQHDEKFEAILHQELANKRNKENTQSWPCLYCSKIFKEDFYLLKHIRIKHLEDPSYIDLQKKIQQENYYNDKNKIKWYNEHTGQLQTYQSNISSNQFRNKPFQRKKRPNFQQKKVYQKEFQYEDLDAVCEADQKKSKALPVINYNDI